MAPHIPKFANVVACRGGEHVRIEGRPTPQPGPGELLLAMRVVGLCGTDLFKLGNKQAAPGTVLGHELVGEVVAMGAGVTGFDLGQRVAVPHHVPCGECTLCLRGNETMCKTFRENLLSPGGFADYLLVRPRAVQQCTYKIPDHVSDAAAAFIEPAACVMRGISRSRLADDAVVAIQGAGSMGLLHLLLLGAAKPAVRTLVVDPVPERQELALALGATAASSPGDDASEQARELSDDLGVDVVFDTVGGEQALAAALTLSREGGAIVLFAHAPDGEQARIDLNALFKYERHVLGTYSGSVKEQRAVFALIADGKFDPTPLVSHQMPLDQFDDAVALARRQQALKILLTPTAIPA